PHFRPYWEFAPPRSQAVPRLIGTTDGRCPMTERSLSFASAIGHLSSAIPDPNRGAPMDLPRLRGIIPPLATPLRDDESIDVEALARLVGFQIEAGVHG